MEQQSPVIPGQANQAQSALWNDRAGRTWAELNTMLDDLLRPVQDLLVEQVATAPASRVLDVGCGGGGTTLAVARHLAPDHECLGIDISAPLIAAAGARAAAAGLDRVRFLRADAQTHDFAGARFDTILSRFGVMFFDDPVAAFANLRRAALPGARLVFAAWRGAADNPFMTTAETAAASVISTIPPRGADGPGQFAFADPAYVRDILTRSGWTAIDIRPVDPVCHLPERDLMTYATRLGPVGLLLQDLAVEDRAQVIAAIRAAFARYVHGDDVRFTAACWLVTARA
ncbi:class I SAM-dependent methyltransferase [Sphingomonas sp. So64.6b]|uniref:class I SAM-dependent methyltransferase n=1 Tax=Sphingomonas sp. So64.6b TaxID=2997354 RepID=UPI00160451F2|nr:class I SAM-dependent methyltransferase [Sphingomonas sp. So64.6b]QNA82822.1 class I SAM-dependent methyltransferase [Sphingomonas sp. So64.6b]